MSRQDVHEAAKVVDWTQIMASENPLRSIRWLIGAAKNRDSQVTTLIPRIQQAFADAVPDVDQVAFTDSNDGEALVGLHEVDAAKWVAKDKRDGHLFERQIRVACYGYWEGLKKAADVTIANDLPNAFAHYAHGPAWWNKPPPPVICLVPTVLDLSAGSPYAEVLRYLGGVRTFWVWVFDNDDEARAVRKAMAAAGHAHYDRVRIVRTYRRPDAPPKIEHDGRVVWMGRMTATKNPTVGQQVFALLPQLDKAVYMPRANVGAGITSMTSMSAAGTHEVWERLPRTTVHVGMSPSEYRDHVATASVGVITSTLEMAPVGYFEQWEAGVIPVVYDAKWTRVYLPADWPFRFRNAVDAAAMVERAIDEYDVWAERLRTWMDERFGEEYNAAQLLAEVWDHYTVSLGDRMRLAAERGERTSL